MISLFRTLVVLQEFDACDAHVSPGLPTRDVVLARRLPYTGQQCGGGGHRRRRFDLRLAGSRAGVDRCGNVPQWRRSDRLGTTDID